MNKKVSIPDLSGIIKKHWNDEDPDSGKHHIVQKILGVATTSQYAGFDAFKIGLELGLKIGQAKSIEDCLNAASEF